jgi:predicted Zn-dependent protease
MKTQSADTHPVTESKLIELLRRKRPAEKMQQVRSLSGMAIQLSRRAIARVNPELRKQELDLLFIRLHYGEPLARRITEYLRKNRE